MIATLERYWVRASWWEAARSVRVRCESLGPFASPPPFLTIALSVRDAGDDLALSGRARHSGGRADARPADPSTRMQAAPMKTNASTIEACPSFFQALWGEQKIWMEQKIAKSEATWQIAVTHFPCGEDGAGQARSACILEGGVGAHWPWVGVSCCQGVMAKLAREERPRLDEEPIRSQSDGRAGARVPSAGRRGRPGLGEFRTSQIIFSKFDRSLPK